MTINKHLNRKIKNFFFPGTVAYWEKRYRNSGHSGRGSYGENAAYKAGYLNRFVKEQQVKSVIELGCGDGNQLSYFDFPIYTGLDVSATAISKCRDKFKVDFTKSFCLYDPAESGPFSLTAELCLSLDVVYHLVEDDLYEKYLYDLFSAAERFVIIYAWDVEGERRSHVRHRCFSKWVLENAPDFKLVEQIIKEPYCDFFVYERVPISCFPD